MKTDYVLTRRALLGISALFCTTLLLFGCENNSTIPVGPELDSPVASETAGDTFAAKGNPHCPGDHPSCEDDGDPAVTPQLTLAGGMSSPTAFDVHLKETKKILKFSNSTKDNFEKPAEIQMAFSNGMCEGIPATNGGPGPALGDGTGTFEKLVNQLTALVKRTEDNVYPKVVIEINQADLLSGGEDHHFLLVQYFDTEDGLGKTTFMLGGWPGPVLVTEVVEGSVFTFKGRVAVLNADGGISCPVQEVLVTLERNPSS